MVNTFKFKNIKPLYFYKYQSPQKNYFKTIRNVSLWNKQIIEKKNRTTYISAEMPG